MAAERPQDNKKEIEEAVKISMRQQLSAVTEKFEANVKYESNDEVVILKSHLVVEYYLNQILALFSESRNKIDKLDFYEKVDEIEKVEKLKKEGYIKPETFASVRALNKVRNEMGHELDFKFTEHHVDKVGFPLGEDYILKKFQNKLNPKALFLYVMFCVVQALYTPIAMEVAMNKIEEIKKVSKEKPQTT